MQSTQNHIIQKQLIELTTTSSKNSFEWERHADEILRTVFNPVIEQCFIDFDPLNQHLIIEKLEINLGSFLAANFAKEAKQKLQEMMSRQLQQYAHGFTHITKAGKDVESHADGKEKNTSGLLSKQSALHKALICFLKEGRFPWWFTVSENKKNLQEQFALEWLHSTNDEQQREIKEIIASDKAAMTRMVNHFDEGWIGACLEFFGWEGKEGLEHWTLFAEILDDLPELQFLLKQNFWMAWIVAKHKGQQYPELHKIIIPTVGTANKQAAALLAVQLQKICRRNILRPGFNFYELNLSRFISTLTLDLQFDLHPDVHLDLPLNETRSDPAVTADVKTGTADVKTRNESIKIQGKPDQDDNGLPKKKPGNVTEEGLFVPCAGIILLHPFLVELFTGTGLWSGEKWSDSDAPFRAIQLLSYLSWGNTGEPEYQLIFHKIITGIEIETALPAALPLSGHEQATCDELLQAVIGHWPALRNTSVAGLQEAFLQRTGKLTMNDRNYLLHVERMAQDVLLSKLPWGYATVKFPWVDKMIHVTWI